MSLNKAIPTAPALTARLARDPLDITAAQRLRYDVFVTEMGGAGPLVDHEARLEKDRFDPFFDHIVLVDPALDPAGLAHVKGVYRVMRCDQAARAGQFYSEDEFDLAPLRASGRRLLELGRSCLAPELRGGAAMVTLWSALAAYIEEHHIDVLFGAASFAGTDVEALAPALSLLHARHLAPEPLRVRAKGPAAHAMDLVAEDRIDRLAAMRAVPALIKAYLKLGGFVGEGVFVDHAFNTTDLCLVLDTARMNSAQTQLYTRGRSL